LAQFSETSKHKLSTCDPQLQELFNAVIEIFDCVILEGHREEERQNWLYSRGASKLQYPNSKHNQAPSKAVDVSPYPVDWQNYHRFYLFSGFVLGAAWRMGINIRWGGDWDGDKDITDQTFNDLVHFELRS
jgi:peptidoglycan L-alanyl-D-glutamate endopeptidase CwlK